jgi:hypothetical protein
MVLSVEPLRNGTGFKDKRKNQIFQFIGQTSENPVLNVTRISTSILHWFDAISIWLLSYQNKVLFVYELC